MEEKRTSFRAQECPITSVTVYPDRAEVSRSLSLSSSLCVEEDELSTLLLTDITQEANPESFRVKGYPGCEILEVSHELVRTSFTSEGADKSAVNSLKTQIDQQKRQLQSVSQRIELVLKERKLIQMYAEDALSKGKEHPSLSLTDAKDVISYHTEEMVRLDEKESLLRSESKEIRDVLDALQNDLSKLSNPSQLNTECNNCSTSYSIAIVISLHKSGLDAALQDEQQLTISYVVSNATWSPSYDMRISSVSNDLSLTYFAEVIQCSGEDWSDCALSLSTSNPAVGSTPPPLPRSTVKIRTEYGGDNNRRNRGIIRRDSESSVGDDDNRRHSFNLFDSEGTQQDQPLNLGSPSAPQIGLKGTGEAGTTIFIIPRKVSIASDNKPHKVTVMVATFSPQLVHYVAPAVSSHAYIQAKTKNTSHYPLLASRRVSVFLDGNFVASSSCIEQTSSGEFFYVYLGVDPSVKVTYTPCRSTQQTKGWISGTEIKKCYYSTVLHNTKQKPCRVIVAEVLPRSDNDKVAVELLDPPASSLVKSADQAMITSERDVLGGLDAFVPQGNSESSGWPKDFVTQNKYTNNIVWLKTIKPGEKVELKLSYKISWPSGQDISINTF